jgi:hypothetical protein
MYGEASSPQQTMPPTGCAPLRIRAFAAIIVFKTNDIIFAEVIPTLNLDDVHGLFKRVRNAMNIADRDVGGLIDAQIEDLIIFGNSRPALHDNPVFGPVGMLL